MCFLGFCGVFCLSFSYGARTATMNFGIEKKKMCQCKQNLTKETWHWTTVFKNVVLSLIQVFGTEITTLKNKTLTYKTYFIQFGYFLGLMCFSRQSSCLFYSININKFTSVLDFLFFARFLVDLVCKMLMFSVFLMCTCCVKCHFYDTAFWGLRI